MERLRIRATEPAQIGAAESQQSLGLPTKPWWRAADAVLLYGLIACLLIPLWATRYLPTQDGPLHLANAVTLVHYDDPGWETARQYYQLNDPRFPTWLVSLILGWLSSVFSAPLAEQMLLSLYVVGLPVVLCFAIRPLTETPQLGGLLVLPVVYNYTFHMGFYAFLLGIVMLLVLIGIWLRSQQQLTFSITLAACVASYLTFQIHPFSWVMTSFALGCIESVEYLNRIRAQSTWVEKLNSSMRLFSQRWYLYLLTIAPGAIHTCVFLSLQKATPSSTASKIAEKLGTSSAAWDFIGERIANLVERVIGLASLSSLVSFSHVEMVLSLGFLAFLISLILLTMRSSPESHEGQPRGRLLLLALGYIAIYLVVKNTMAGGGFVACRIQLLALISLITWLASSNQLPRFRALVGCLSSLFVGLSVVYYALTYQRIGDAIDRQISLAIHIDEGSTIMPVVLPDLDREPVILHNITPNPLLHAEGHFVYQRRVVDLGNYQGWKGYFPLRFRSSFNPAQHVAANGQVGLKANVRIPELNLASQDHGDVFVDYVLIVGSIDDFKGEPEVRSLSLQLERSFDRIAVESGSPPISLFRHKESNHP